MFGNSASTALFVSNIIESDGSNYDSNLCGTDKAGIYSVAYSGAMILQIVGKIYSECIYTLDL